MGEETRHACPDNVYKVCHKNPELNGVAVEKVDLQRRPAQSYDHEPHHHGQEVVPQRVQYVVLDGEAFEQSRGPYEEEGEQRVDDEDVDPHLTT